MKVDFLPPLLYYSLAPPQHSWASLLLLLLLFFFRYSRTWPSSGGDDEEQDKQQRTDGQFVFNVCTGHKSYGTKRKLQVNVTNHTLDPCFTKISSRRRLSSSSSSSSYIPESPISDAPQRIHVPQLVNRLLLLLQSSPVQSSSFHLHSRPVSSASTRPTPPYTHSPSSAPSSVSFCT